MAYIKRNVNILLLLLIVLIVAAFAGVSSYYQGTYRNLSKSYGLTVETLNFTEKNLSSRQQELAKTAEELELRTADKAKFEAMYGNLTEQKEIIDRMLAETKDELESVKADLSATQERVTALTTEVDTLNEDVRMKQLSINRYKNLLCQYNQTYC